MSRRPSKHLIRRIFAQAGLGAIGEVCPLEVGFSNHLYAVDGRYVLKVGKSAVDEVTLRREIFLCRRLRGRVPAPEIIATGTMEGLVAKHFIIYERLPGENLYLRWHLLDDAGRREVVRQICGMLRAINEAPYEEFAREFGIDPAPRWQAKMGGAIERYLGLMEAREALSEGLIARIRRFLGEHLGVLEAERMALTYWDAHFDNFLVRGHEVVGMLDFEGADISSIDYVLDMVYRMVREPTKYASARAEPLVRAEDYAKLPAWYQEYYPELFSFPELDRRLDIYRIEHALCDLYWYPEGEAARAELARLVG